MASQRTITSQLEMEFFRALNRVVEPRVRKGLGAPGRFPTGLVVLETLGRVSGRWRRTPLVAARIGAHVLVSTVRGKRSQWVMNLASEPRARLWLGGKRREMHVLLLHEGKRSRLPRGVTPALRALLKLLLPFTRLGWSFALLSPPTQAAAPKRRAGKR